MLGELKSCKSCGKLFNYQGHGYGYCNDCAALDGKILYSVKEYIWQNESVSETEVSEALGISVNQIHGYLQESRLELPEASPIRTSCERCGKKVRYGKYCGECKGALVLLKGHYNGQEGLEKLFSKPQNTDAERNHAEK